MEQPQQRSKSMVFVLVVSAIFLAVATFLTILLITSRTPAPELLLVTTEPTMQTTIILVNGVPITVHIDPNKAILLEGEQSPTPVPDSNQVVIPTNTSVPVPTVPTATPVPPTATPRPDPIKLINYQVVAGDTLYSIAETQNSSVALMADKGFDAADLTPGNILEGLPVANPAYCPNGSRAYVVRDKDTVFSIANRFNTTVDAIAQLNQLDAAYHIEMTQVICIPT